MIAWLGKHAFLLAVVVSLVALFEPGPMVPSGPQGSDKVVHALLFGLLAVTGRWAGLRTRPLAIGLLAYAAVSEVLQATLPIRRDGDVRDLLADAVGIALGLVGWLLAEWLLRRRRRARRPTP